jgi:hypothetical protein
MGKIIDRVRQQRREAEARARMPTADDWRSYYQARTETERRFRNAFNAAAVKELLQTPPYCFFMRPDGTWRRPLAWFIGER